MPNLLRSSETAGCGATIELDSKEVVYVSIAQSGVIVRLWDMHGGFFKNFMTNFTGPLLYNEKNVYKNAQTGMQLKLRFPQQAPELNFKNPVLSAFSNAIWNCASAARVAAVLNEAATNAPAAEELAERIAMMQAADARQSRAAERIDRYDLTKRPFTRALLTLAAELIYEADKVISPVDVEEPKTLEAEIDRSVMLVATAIVGSAALGATGGLLTPGDPHNFLVATFAFIVLISLANPLAEEGYRPNQENTIGVIKVLFVALDPNDITTIYKDGSRLFMRFVEEGKTSQKASEFFDDVTQLAYYYVIDKNVRDKDKTQKLFQSLLKSLIAVA